MSNITVYKFCLKIDKTPTGAEKTAKNAGATFCRTMYIRQKQMLNR